MAPQGSTPNASDSIELRFTPHNPSAAVRPPGVTPAIYLGRIISLALLFMLSLQMLAYLCRLGARQSVELAVCRSVVQRPAIAVPL